MIRFRRSARWNRKSGSAAISFARPISELQTLGVLNLRHGKGVLVQKQLCLRRPAIASMRNAKRFRERFLSRLREVGVSPSAFARYLYQQAREQETQSPFVIFVDASKPQAVERAGHISAIWQVNVPGYSLEELAALPKQELRKIRKVLTNYIRFDQVRRIVGNHAEVIPLGLTFC